MTQNILIAAIFTTTTISGLVIYGFIEDLFKQFKRRKDKKVM